jgi:hypothetical protein
MHENDALYVARHTASRACFGRVDGHGDHSKRSERQQKSHAKIESAGKTKASRHVWPQVQKNDGFDFTVTSNSDASMSALRRRVSADAHDAWGEVNHLTRSVEST